MYAAALAIYQELARAEPGVYRPHLATSLNNLGAVGLLILGD
jgi:hypothetical protein